MLTLRTLGLLCLRDSEGNEIAAILSQPKRCALLIYLALGPPGGFHRRDTLLSLFWPEGDGAHARNALSQTLFYLRHHLSEEVVLTRGTAAVGLAPGSVTTDVQAFEAAIDEGRWTEALELYGGDFLSGFHAGGAWGFEEWMAGRRVHLAEAAAGAAWALAYEQLGAGRVVEAERSAQQALALKWSDETPVREFISALAEAGDRAAAVTLYEAFRSKLLQELGLEPSEATRDVVDAIRRAERAGVVPSAGAVAARQGSDSARRTPSTAGLAAKRAIRSHDRDLPTRPRPTLSWSSGSLAVTAAFALAVVAISFLLSRRPDVLLPAGGDGGVPVIAVLPLDNLSPDPDDDFFAGGVQESLTTKLDRISTLDVISRNSADRYRDPLTRPATQQIAAELGADYLIEGSARVDGDSVWITVQLIEGATDLHRWADVYKERYTPTNYVRLQAEIVQRIASDLRLAISPEDRAWLEAVPTASLEAFEAYTRGREAYLDERRRALLSVPKQTPSVGLFEEAVGLDPAFALAHAALALTLAHTLPNEGREERTRRAAERALTLGGEIPEARLALHYYYEDGGNPEEAARQLDLAEKVAPDDFEVMRRRAAGQRQRGQYDRAVETLRRAERLYPLNPLVSRDLGILYTFLHRYDDALSAFERVVARSETPGPLPFLWQARIHLARGEPDQAREATSELMQADERFVYGLYPSSMSWVVFRVLGAEERQRAFAASKAEWRGRVETSCAFPHLAASCLRYAVHESEVGSAAKGRILWDSLRLLVPHPAALDQPLEAMSQALIYLGAGEPEGAVATMRGAFERWAPDGCAGFHPADICQMTARVLAHAGRPDEAIDLLTTMLPAPSWLTVHLLEVDPMWDPLRAHPRFKALLARYAGDVEH